jgi:hypothetical protein
MQGQAGDGAIDPIDDRPRCTGIVGRNEVVNVVDVRDRLSCPLDRQRRHLANAARTSASDANSPASACRMPS